MKPELSYFREKFRLLVDMALLTRKAQRAQHWSPCPSHSRRSDKTLLSSSPPLLPSTRAASGRRHAGGWHRGRGAWADDDECRRDSGGRWGAATGYIVTRRIGELSKEKMEFRERFPFCSIIWGYVGRLDRIGAGIPSGVRGGGPAEHLISAV
jgi:hypothetical protein